MTRRRLVIISDLHISNGELDDFDQEIEGHLLTFLEHIAAGEDGCELIINGDFLDFVQATPWSGASLESCTTDGIPLCFTEEQSVAKLSAIAKDHPRVFSGLQAFLAANERNLLVVMPGNHDPDFFWPKIRKLFCTLVGHGSTQRVVFNLSGPHRPMGYEWLWIEHGHRFDPVNAFFVGDKEHWTREQPPLLADRDGTLRLLECTGTRFLIRYLNGIDARYPFVDNVKPFSRFIRIFGASALTFGRGPLDAAVAVTKMLGFLAASAMTRPGDLLGFGEAGEVMPPHPLAVWLARAKPDDRRALKRHLEARGIALARPLSLIEEQSPDFLKLIDFLADNLDLISDIKEDDDSLLGTGAGTLTLAKGFRANETEDLFQGALAEGRDGVTTVVMGHTHEPIERSEAIAYFNTGSWTRYYRFGESEATQPWRLLRERSYERFPYSLRYVDVPSGATHATMETWRERLAE